MDTGCSGCHNGVVVGGGMFRKFGVVEDYWKETGSKEIDKGRFDVTNNPADMYVFKCRDFATSPWRHHTSTTDPRERCLRPFASWPRFNWAKRSPIRTRTRS